MARDIFLEGHLKGLRREEIFASYNDAVKEVLVDKIKKVGKCKISRPVFGFFSSTPNSWGITSFEEADVITSYDELIALARAEGCSEKSIISDYELGFLKIVPVK